MKDPLPVIVDLSARRRRNGKALTCLKSLYYYRWGRLELETVDNSGLALLKSNGAYVSILRYCKTRQQFLVSTHCGRRIWTNALIQVAPMVNGVALHASSFAELLQHQYQAGEWVKYRTCGEFAFLAKGHIPTTYDKPSPPQHTVQQRGCAFGGKTTAHTANRYEIYRDGVLNVQGLPRGFNFLLGYVDGLAMENGLAPLDVYAMGKLGGLNVNEMDGGVD